MEIRNMTVHSENARPRYSRIDSEEAMAMAALELCQAKDSNARCLGRMIREVGVPFTRHMIAETERARTVEAVAELANAVTKLAAIMLSSATSTVPPSARAEYLDRLVVVMLEHIADQHKGMEATKP
jgi:hypothetical protein